MNSTTILQTFPDQESCIKFLENLRWNGKPICPYCKSTRTVIRKNSLRHHCRFCRRSFSVTVGTLFHSTKLPIIIWFRAICLMFNAKKGISARQLSRELGINKDSAWALAMRIRAGMGDRDPLLFSFKKEVCTHYRGQSPARMKGIQLLQHRGHELNNIILINLGRWVRTGFESRKRPKIIPKQFKKRPNSKVEALQIKMITNLFSERKRKGSWTLINRAIIGQYHQISSRYLHGYLDEICFRKAHPDGPETFEKLISNLLIMAVPFCGTCTTSTPVNQNPSST